MIGQFYDQKRFENHRGPQFLDIIKQARKNQNIHEVFRNKDLTDQIVMAGYTQRRPPSSSSNFYILPSALSHYFY